MERFQHYAFASGVSNDDLYLAVAVHKMPFHKFNTLKQTSHGDIPTISGNHNEMSFYLSCS